ncbi:MULTISPECIES: RluA family pseudouridine synthase [unclassified Leptospira]|uniref:RluA family pseudouridine synthase n=1 Tax=unclassified Leptospira TaxID=2633828 RepID=UPI0002926079|nr:MULTISPECIES: RNA pseudouridine synthase [unclassified Leptospira]EKO76669.1 RNA pseudouridine synthase [Leptospira sp. Fiocruz LV3954]EMI65147.1 RNA pseudouridine synthase [Leptospira sp. Fiocruz LV4135]
MTEEHLNIRILYENESYIFAEKPPGIPVHATKDSKRENFADILQKQLSLDYLRTVNRLDLETSGLVFFCKNPDKNKEADRILKTSVKIYLCVVSGTIPEEHFLETCYIKDGNKKVRKVFSGGDKAVTEFLTLQQNPKERYSVLLAKLHTGRRHQIRLHLSEKGFPILGDRVYGESKQDVARVRKTLITSDQSPSPKRKPQRPITKRSLLHAIGVSFETANGRKERIFCPPPPDFRNFLDGIVLDDSIFSKFSLK